MKSFSLFFMVFFFFTSMFVIAQGQKQNIEKTILSPCAVGKPKVFIVPNN